MNSALKGLVKVDVVDHNGQVVRAGRWQRNLVLDQGLNQLAETLICDLFKYAVKGNDAAVMKETVGGGGTYTLNTTLNTVTRTAGTRDFTANDVGKLIRSANGKECIIESFTSATVVGVRPVGTDTLTAYTNQAIVIYAVQKVGMDTESDRTNDYSIITGENTTTRNGGVWTHKRTFLFASEPANIEDPDASNTYTWAGTTVTRNTSPATPRDFTSADVGKYILFPATGEFCKITARTSNTVVTVDRAPVLAHTNVAGRFYGFNSYSHIGFSHTDTAGDNLNILVRLENGSGVATPVLALGENPETPGQQIKVTYQMTVTFTPTTSASGSGGIYDPNSDMSATKNYTAVLEAVAASYIAGDGDTVIDSAGLEPSVGGEVAMSPTSNALVPLTSNSVAPDRSLGAQSIGMNVDDYVPDTFTRTVSGTFGINDAIGTTYRSIGIYDSDNRQFLYTMLFTTAQKKPGTHQLILRFRKSWNRDLS